MDKIEKNVILDLLPVYLSGEASEETKALVEKFANANPDILQLLNNDDTEETFKRAGEEIPESLELKTLKNVKNKIRRKMIYVALATALLLMIPFTAMFYTNEVNWSPFDFLVMGTLLFAAGGTFVIVSSISEKILYKLAAGVAVLSGFLLVWVNLAVGFIGAETNPVNLLYLGVLLTGLVGAVFSKFRSSGMAKALFVTAIAQFSVPVIVWIFWPVVLQEPPGAAGIFVLNSIFAGLFAFSSLLFYRSQNKQRTRN